MGSSSEKNSKGIDASVGGLVWVRRRNGSWWPGRIMGLNELSETSLVSPRSGTPVKLLGREDASVDWYNIEKSKRVKAFRCGEYDECIEKAKDSAAHVNKKAVKYARREDAILHALELESGSKLMEHQPFCLRAENPIGKNFGPGKEKCGHVIGKLNMLDENSAQELSQSVISFEQASHATALKVHFVQKSKRKTPNDSEDDGTEGTKRMRGLQDLVLPDSASPSESNIGNSLCSSSPVNSKGSCSTLMRRRSQVAQVHESFRRKNRRRPLTKVLENTTKVDIPGLCDHRADLSLLAATESKISALESAESKRTSSSVVINNNSNCTETSCDKEISVGALRRICDTGVDAVQCCSDKDNDFPEMLEFPDNDCSDNFLNALSVKEEHRTGGFSHVFASSALRKLRTGAIGRRSSHCGRGESKLLSGGLDEMASTSFVYETNRAKQRTGKDASKWQSKGKRNSRYLSKKSIESPDSRSFMDRVNQSHEYTLDRQSKNGVSIGFGLFDDSDNDEQAVKWDDAQVQIAERNSLASCSLTYGKPIMGKSTAQARKKAAFFTRGSPVHPEMPQRSIPHRQYPVAVAPTNGFPLFDVNLNVRASYLGQRVPLVSLMSKLNGKAIVGHPLTVEVLEDGCCDLLMNRADCELYDSPRINGNAAEQSPDIANPLFSALNRRDDTAETCQVMPSLRSEKSPKLRRCGLLSKKTRKLSSISVGCECKEEERKPVVEKLGRPGVACVPVKIVFSRIKAAVGCSARPPNQILTPSSP